MVTLVNLESLGWFLIHQESSTSIQSKEVGEWLKGGVSMSKSAIEKILESIKFQIEDEEERRNLS